MLVPPPPDRETLDRNALEPEGRKKYLQSLGEIYYITLLKKLFYYRKSTQQIRRSWKQDYVKGHACSSFRST